MRLIKINNDLINEDKFIGLFWEEGRHAVAHYYGSNDALNMTTLATGIDWRETMKEAAESMLFDLDQEEKELFDGERRTEANK